ncbi:MAG TPA: LLM class flavin-dependent oxidoreductase [Candidatus Methylomirabilis sp.]|nr:LLM class flavin-dependent oxidoreductase [Candidatus Methylomirabilis sp.]
MNVKFGISFGSNPVLLSGADVPKFTELVRRAEGYGAVAIGTYDSGFLGGDAYMRATLMAQATSRAAIGLRPSNPLTREPQIMASFLASLDALTNGRAFLDIASGDSAVFNIGFPAASRARIEDYVSCVRGLLAKGESTYQGRPQRVRWAASAVRPRVPISICAEGPRMLHLGGRIGDGVIAGTGLLPEVIKDTIARIHAGARDAGRDPSDVDIWFTTRNALDVDHDTAMDRVKASVSSILNHAMRFGLEGKLLPDEMKKTVQEYVDGYELYDHVLHAGRNPKRMDELGLTDYALRRWALAGTPKDWIARIEQIADAGAAKIWVGLGGHDLDRQLEDLRMLGEEIMPRFVR